MINQSNWYLSFFDGLATEMWHNAVPPAITAQEVGFITKCVGHTPCSILDVPSGTGRHTLALAAQGYTMTAVDISADNIARLDAARQALPVATYCADILSFTSPGQYDAAICMGNSFSYFPAEGMVAFAKKIRAALRPGGKFIINSGSVAEDVLPNLKPAFELHVGDIHFAASNKYLANERVVQTEMRFAKGNTVEEKTAYHFIYSLDEIRGILMDAGFSELSLYGSTDMAPYSAGKGQLFAVAG